MVIPTGSPEKPAKVWKENEKSDFAANGGTIGKPDVFQCPTLSKVSLEKEKQPPDRKKRGAARTAIRGGAHETGNCRTTSERKSSTTGLDGANANFVKAENAAAIEQAVRWYAGHRTNCPRPIVLHLRERFGLSAADAVKVLSAVSSGRYGGAK
ncbi:MAG: hypothetical protein VYD64_03220 [Pseudomonadota bacterium]|nr:hypothetical protein [Pseudomonadota bacterium]